MMPDRFRIGSNLLSFQHKSTYCIVKKRQNTKSISYEAMRVTHDAILCKNSIRIPYGNKHSSLCKGDAEIVR
jgi:hypothetical protein